MIWMRKVLPSSVMMSEAAATGGPQRSFVASGQQQMFLFYFRPLRGEGDSVFLLYDQLSVRRKTLPTNVCV